MQGKQRQDEDLVKFGLPGRTTCVPSWRAWAEGIAGPGIRGTFALRLTGSGLAGGSPDRPPCFTRARGEGRQGRPTARRRGRSDRVGERFGASNRWQVPFTRHVPG